MPRNDINKFIRDSLKKEGVSNQAANFFIYLVSLFPGSNPGRVPINNTTKKLSEDFGYSERTIRRYINELKNDHNYIRVQPHYNNDNPSKPYIEYNIYHLLDDSIELLEKATLYSQREKNVFFVRGTN